MVAPVQGYRDTYGPRPKPKPQQQYNLDPIPLPGMPSLEEALKQIQGSGILPTYTPVEAGKVNFNAVNYNPVAGITDTLGDDYFNNILSQSEKRLQRKFFDAPDSAARRQQNTMSKRGLLGSGIEVGGMNDLNRTYGDELVDVYSNVDKMRAESAKELAFRNKDIEMQNAQAALDVGKFNTQGQRETEQFNVQQAMEAAQKNRDFQGFLSELGLSSAGDLVRAQTDFGTKMYDTQVDAAQSDKELASNLLETLATTLGEENIDPDTRNLFESLFGSMYGNIFGVDFGDLKDPTTGEGVGAGSSKAPKKHDFILDPTKDRMTDYGYNVGDTVKDGNGFTWKWNGNSWQRVF